MATITVNPAGGADQTTIAAAIAAANSGDIISLQAGTYDQDTQVWPQVLPANKNLTIKSADPATPVTLNTVTECATTGWFRVASDGTGFTTEFQDIIFKLDMGYKAIVSWGNDCGGGVTFTRCTVNNDDVDTTSYIAFCGTNSAPSTYKRKLRFIDTTITQTAFTGSNLMVLVSMDLLEFDGCTITYGQASAELYTLTGTNGDLITKDCTFSTKGTVAGTASGTVRSIRFVDNSVTLTVTNTLLNAFAFVDCTILTPPIITGNTFHSDGSATQGIVGVQLSNVSGTCVAPGAIIANNVFSTTQTEVGATTAIKVQAGVTSCSVVNNSIVGYYNGAVLDSPTCIVTGNIISGCNPLRFNGGQGHIVTGNTLIGDDWTVGRGDGGRCLVLSRRNITTEVAKANVTFAATTATSSAAWTVSSVATDGTHVCIASTASGDSFVPTHYGIVSGTGVNSVTVVRWVKCSDESTETPTNGNYYIRVVDFPRSCSIYNNIMDGSASASTFTFDYNPRSGNNYINYNCYRYGTTNFSNLGWTKAGSQTTTLAQQITVWRTWPTTNDFCYSNDINSIAADPQFVNAASGDFALKGGSPCLTAGRMDTGRGRRRTIYGIGSTPSYPSVLNRIRRFS